MFYFKIISSKPCWDEKKIGILSLSPEMIEYLLTFCEKKDLFKVRLANSQLCRWAYRGLAERLHLDWRFCLANQLDPLQLVRYNPTLYFANLTKPIHLCAHTLPESCLHDLKPDFIHSFLTLHPKGDVSVPSAVIELDDSLAAVINGREVLIWKSNKRGDKFCRISGEKRVSLVYKDPAFKLYAISIRGATRLVRSHSNINPKLTDHLKKGVTIQGVYSNDIVILAKLSNEKLIYITDPDNLSPPPDISSEDKIEKVLLLESNLFLVWLESGRVFVWGENLDDPKQLMIPEDQKIRSITASTVDFTILLDDRRTVIQYGYLGGNFYYGLRMTSFQFRNHSLIKDIYVNDEDYLALLENDKIIYWSHSKLLNKEPVFPEKNNVRSIFKTSLSFCILLDDGRILNWGRELADMENFPSDRSVNTVVSTHSGFVALLDNQTVYPWGHPLYGGEIPEVLEDVPIKAVFSSKTGFMALLEDGRVCFWGGRQFLSHKMIDIPKNSSVKCILPSENSFLIQLDTGEVVAVFIMKNYPFYDEPLVRSVLSRTNDRKLSIIDKKNFFIDKKGTYR